MEVKEMDAEMVKAVGTLLAGIGTLLAGLAKYRKEKTTHKTRARKSKS